ncbi:putative oxidoreductase YdhV [subsurface metagenome]
MSFTGQILRIDLTEQKITKERLPKEFFANYLGGRGIGIKILFDELQPKTDPLSPENIMIFSTGTLGGTFAPASSRLTITSKSPETNFYCKTTVGGFFSPELKFAGYDAIVVTGAAPKPVYLYIKDDLVEIRDASHLWGKDVRETDRMLKQELEDDRISVLSIGPAGENLVKYSAIMTNIYRAAARGGMGTVMGSKKLKAITVRGSGSVRVANPEKFSEIALRARELVKEDTDRFFRYFFFGTQRGIVWANEAGFNATKNFQTAYIKDAYRIGGEYIREKYLTGETGCGSCTLCCGTFYKVNEGPFAGSHSEGPEWETCNSFGSRLCITDTEFLLRANELSNIYGLDISSAGGIIAFAMELYEKGFLNKKDTDGLDLSWGNTESVLELLRKITYREGFGNVLAESLGSISKKYKSSEKFAMCVKGLQITSIDPRLSIPYALAFAVNPRGGDHLHSEIICQFGATPEHVEIAQRVSGSPEGAKPLTFAGKARLVKYHEQVCCASDSLGICFFHTLSSHRVNPEIMADLFEAATGIPMSPDKLNNACEKMLNLERLFNIQEGLTREDDTLPRRAFEEEIASGPSKGLKLSAEAFNKLVEEYYELHGWDSNGIPRKETLARHGIESTTL